jgi:hypothetical protein
MTFKGAQRLAVVGQEPDENIGTQVVDIVGAQANTAAVSSMVCDVNKQANEAIDEVAPCTRFFRNASFEQTAINFRESHAHST